MTSGSNSTTVAPGQNNLIANKTNSNGVVGEWYNRIASNVNSANGNMRLGCYTNGASVPSALLSETASHAAVNGFNWQSATEWALTTTVNWIAQVLDSDTNSVFNLIDNPSTGLAYPMAHTYGALPSSFTPGAGNLRQYNMKIGHS